MAKDIYEIVGVRVREERKRAGLTIEQLAELADISPSFLAYIETRGRKSSLETIQKLADALRIPVADFFKTLPAAEKDTLYDAAQKFIHLIRDKDKAEIETALDIVKVALKGRIGAKKKS